MVTSVPSLWGCDSIWTSVHPMRLVGNVYFPVAVETPARHRSFVWGHWDGVRPFWERILPGCPEASERVEIPGFHSYSVPRGSPWVKVHYLNFRARKRRSSKDQIHPPSLIWKPGKNTWNNDCPQIRQQAARDSDPWEGKSTWGSSRSLLLLPGEFRWHDEWGHLLWPRQEMKLGEVKTASEVRELGDLQKVALSLQLSMGQWEARGGWAWEKNPPKGRKNNFQSSHRPEADGFPTGTHKKTRYTQGTGEGTLEFYGFSIREC